MGLFNWLFGKPEVFEVVDDTPPQAERQWRKPRGAVKVWRYCRASKVHGREIYCPQCSAPSTVYNFAWSVLKCTNCENSSERRQWYTVRTEKELKRQITQAEAKAGGKKWKELKRQITQAEAKAGGKK
jgi:hypothetical protein